MSLNNLSEENKIFVSKLFGIKAGLSMISLEVDKIRNAEAIMKKYTDDIDNGENTLKRVNERVQGFSARVEEYKSYVSADNKRKVKKFISAGVWLTLGIVMVIAGIVGMVVGIVSDTAMVSTMSLISGLFGGAVGCAVAGYDVYCAFRIPGADSNAKRLKEWTEAFDGEVKRAETCERELIETKKKRDEFAPVCQRTLKYGMENCLALYRSLYETYNDTLDESDWGSIDYIIYVYATQRADTLPAALKCLDDERRYLGVVNAIEKASNEISATINQAFSELSQQLSSQFASLESTINRNTSRIVDGLGGIAATVADNTDAINRVNGSINVQNALQAKANKNTKALADDMSYIVTRIRSNGI